MYAYFSAVIEFLPAIISSLGLLVYKAFTILQGDPLVKKDEQRFFLPIKIE